jgi:WD40 repeat protein
VITDCLSIATDKEWIGEVIRPPRVLTRDELIRPFRDPSKRWIAVFHFAGHANPFELFLEGTTSREQRIGADAFAQFLSSQFGLKLVFLNGCSTRQQAKSLVDVAGVDVVIATSRLINDDIAQHFAREFYKDLVKGATVREAFNHAQTLTKDGLDGRGLVRTASPESNVGPTCLRALVWGDEPGEATGEASLWPWELFPREALPDTAGWKLEELKEDPNDVLPRLIDTSFHRDRQRGPYPGFQAFTRADARAFYGRSTFIRELYEEISSPNTAPIVLVFGTSGVGKSSLLDAGLFPRLKGIVDPVYERLDKHPGSIAEVLRSALGGTPNQSLLEMWKTREAIQNPKPVVVLIDQVEELFRRPTGAFQTERKELCSELANIFGNPETRPAGKLILSFIEDKLAAVKQLLKEANLEGVASERFIQTLSSDEVIEAIRLSPAVRRHYGLVIEPRVAELIAHYLTRVSGLVVAPTLQILLADMWMKQVEASRGRVEFTEKLFWAVEQQGIGLEAFLSKQIREIESWNKSVVESGLLLDLLATHTESSGRASECRVQDLRKAYAHKARLLSDLIDRCKTTYLLVDPAADTPRETGQRLRLAHDTLAPLVRKQYEASPAPGQQARRILEMRVKDSPNHRSDSSAEQSDLKEGEKGGDQLPARGVSPVMDGADLAVVERGQVGMRDWKPAEAVLVAASQKARRWRVVARWAAVTLIVVGLGAAGWEWWRAESERQTQRALKLAAQSQAEREDRPQRAALLAVAAANIRPEERAVIQSLRDVAATCCGRPLEGHEGGIYSLSLCPGKPWLATGGTEDGKVILWELPNDGSAPKKLTELQVKDGKAKVNKIVFSGEGKWLAVAVDGRVLLWDLSKGIPSIGSEYGPGGSNRQVSLMAFPNEQRFVTVEKDDNAMIRLYCLPPNNLAPQGQLLSGATGTINQNALAASPDGRWLFAGGSALVVWRWDLQHPVKAAVPLYRHDKQVQAIAISPDGNWVASGGDDKRVILARLNNPLAGARAAALIGVAAAGASQSPLGAHAVSTANDGLDNRVVARRAAALIGVAAAAGAFPSLFGAHAVMTADDGQGRDFDFLEHEHRVFALAFTHNAKPGEKTWLVSGSEDKTARIWDLDGIGQGKLSHSSRILAVHDGWVNRLAITGDDEWVVTGSLDKTARCWNLHTGMELCVLRGQENTLRGLAVSIDPGKKGWAAVISEDGSGRLWDLRTENPPRADHTLFGHTDTIFAAAVDPATGWAVTGGADETAWLWNLNEARVTHGARPLQHTYKDWVTAVAISERWIVTASANGEVIYWDRGTSAAPVTRPGIALNGHKDGVHALTLRENLVVTGSDDGTTCIWDLGKKDRRTSPLQLPRPKSQDPRPKSWIRSVAISPNKKQVLTGSYDNKAYLWNASDGSFVCDFDKHTGPVTAVGFVSNARVVTASADGTALLWRLGDSGEPIQLFPEKETRQLRGLSISKNGRWLVITGDAPMVWLYDLCARDVVRSRRSLKGDDRHRVTGSAFSPDGRWLVVSSYRGSYLWDLSSPKPEDSRQVLTRVVPSDELGGWSWAVAISNQHVLTSSGKLALRWHLRTNKLIEAAQVGVSDRAREEYQSAR